MRRVYTARTITFHSVEFKMYPPIIHDTAELRFLSPRVFSFATKKSCHFVWLVETVTETGCTPLPLHPHYRRVNRKKTIRDCLVDQEFVTGAIEPTKY
jgi:hypothetical protein